MPLQPNIPDKTQSTPPINPSQNTPFPQNLEKPNESKENKPKDTTPPPNPQELIISPHTPQKYGGKKVIATIFGILLLIGGVAAGVLLVQRIQEIRERATSGIECEWSSDCILLNNPGNSGSFSAPRAISHIFISTQRSQRFDPPKGSDGCYDVTIETTKLTWKKVGTGTDCQDINNIQVWLVEEISHTPMISPIPTFLPSQTPTPQEPMP